MSVTMTNNAMTASNVIGMSNNTVSSMNITSVNWVNYVISVRDNWGMVNIISVSNNWGMMNIISMMSNNWSGNNV